MDNFPPNSRKAEPRVEKDIARVTSARAVRRKQPLGRKFKSIFFGGDARTAAEYMVGNVLVPAAKEAIVEAASSGFEKLVYGDARPRRGSRYGAPPSGPTGYVNYQQRSSRQAEVGPPQQPNRLARQSRARHDFDDIVINTRQEAEEVLERMFDALSKYESVSVADLYELTGIKSDHVDHKWGWLSLRGAAVARVRSGGYLLDLPEPEFLDR